MKELLVVFVFGLFVTSVDSNCKLLLTAKFSIINKYLDVFTKTFTSKLYRIALFSTDLI